MEFAERVRHLAPEGAYFMLARAQALEAAGRDIIHLEIGQPDAPTFEHIAEAGIQAIRDGHTRYTPPAGLPRLREVIAEFASRQHAMEIRPAQVVVGAGTKPALFFPTLALVRPGDEVIYPDPGFPTYRDMIGVAGGVPVPVPLREETGFAFDLDAFDAALSHRTRMIVLNSPSNPTGGVLSMPVLEHIAHAAVDRDLWVLSDEIYSRLVFDGVTAPSIATLPGMAGRTVISDGFSKTYSMTGWRLGYGIMPEALAERVELLITHSTGCAAAFTQIAGIAALTGPQDRVAEVLAEYQRRRDVLVSWINAIPGLHCQAPQGAFYTFPNIMTTGKTSGWITEYLLNEAGVAALPGTAFGANGEGYIRFCFANSIEKIERAMDRVAAAMARL